MKLAPSPIPDPGIAEAFQGLRVQVDLADRRRGLHTLLVASPYPGRDKAVVAAYLGAVFAQAGRRVVLVSGDLHQPELEALLDVESEPGLTDAAVEDLHLSQVLHRTGIPNLEIIPAGEPGAHPADVLASPAVGQVLKEAQTAADVVIIESPPVLTGAEAAMLVPHCDGILLVLQAGRSTRADTLAAKTALEKVRDGAVFLGAVLTNAHDGSHPRRYKATPHLSRLGWPKRRHRGNGSRGDRGVRPEAAPQGASLEHPTGPGHTSLSEQRSPPDASSGGRVSWIGPDTEPDVQRERIPQSRPSSGSPAGGPQRPRQEFDQSPPSRDVDPPSPTALEGGSSLSERVSGIDASGSRPEPPHAHYRLGDAWAFGK
jgi:capsular exopolysaccharide synthesis family protein